MRAQDCIIAPVMMTVLTVIIGLIPICVWRYGLRDATNRGADDGRMASALICSTLLVCTQSLSSGNEREITQELKTRQIKITH